MKLEVLTCTRASACATHVNAQAVARGWIPAPRWGAKLISFLRVSSKHCWQSLARSNKTPISPHEYRSNERQLKTRWKICFPSGSNVSCTPMTVLMTMRLDRSSPQSSEPIWRQRPQSGLKAVETTAVSSASEGDHRHQTLRTRGSSDEVATSTQFGSKRRSAQIDR